MTTRALRIGSALLLSWTALQNCKAASDKVADASPEAPAPAKQLTKVRLHITLRDPRLSLGAPVRVKVALVNEGSREVLVNRRMAEGYAEKIKAGFEVSFRIVGPDGKPHPYDCMTQYADPMARHYSILEPGKSFERELLLNDCHDLSRPGTYEIVATYRDRQIPSPKQPPPGVEPFVGELVSNTLRFEYLPPPPGPKGPAKPRK